MAYFQRKPAEEDSYTRHFSPAEEGYAEEEWDDEEYDDGFDELMEEDSAGDDDPAEEMSGEEVRLEKRRKYRIAAGIGDFGATLVGVVVILALVAFLINMIRFVSSDFSQNFSLWSTKF